MNCREWEERIAADLDDPGVVRHVADCAGCQVFASGLRETLETLRTAHADPIAPAHYAAVRARVMAELGPRRRWGWIWAVAGVAAVLMLAGIEVQREMRVAELPLRVAAVVPPAPAAPVAERRRVAIAKRPVVAKKAAPAEEIVVKVETGDPDVVIYWITETKGEN
jgi:hypothetical protein